MSQEIEIEFKNMLTQKEYEHLLKIYGGTSPDTWSQTNHYADTPDFKLKKNGSALRIRELPYKIECTLKTPFQHHLLETTMQLSSKDANEMLSSNTFILSEGILSLLSKMEIDVKELHFFTFLITERFELKKDHCLIVLDKNTYGNKTDYELEVEASDEDIGWSFFQKFLLHNEIPRRVAENKVKRAMDEIRTL